MRHVQPLQKVLSIDPGRNKCGVAIVARNGEVLLRRIYHRRELMQALPPLIRQQSISEVALGDATAARQIRSELRAAVPELAIKMVDESGSTLAARLLYWKVHPPRGWRRWIPLSLQNPPEPIDDYAAVVVGRRFFGRPEG